MRAIQEQHEELLHQSTNLTTNDTSFAKEFLNVLAQSGEAISDEEYRDQLRTYIRYWSNYINDKDGNFPYVRLQPFDKSKLQEEVAQDIEQNKALLEIQKEKLTLEQMRLEILQEHLELEKARLNIVIETANKVVDTLQPDADEQTKVKLIQALLPDLLLLTKNSEAGLSLLASQSTESQNLTLETTSSKLKPIIGNSNTAEEVPKKQSLSTETPVLHFGVIGWGYWGPKIARNLDSLPHAVITMVADSDAHRLASLSVNQYQSWVRKTTQVEDIFRSDIDGIVIATPVQTHYQLAKEALLHDKHVLVENPLTASVVEAEELIALAQEKQRVLMVGHTTVYNPAVNELRKLVQSGDLGKIYSVEVERVNLGLFRTDINVIWDLAPHDIATLLYILNKKPEWIKVQAHAHLQPHIPDIAHLDLGFADGMTANIHVSWLHPLKIRRVTMIGDARMVVYDDTSPAEMLKIYNKGADVHADPVASYRFGEITIPHIDWIEPLRLECEDFVNAIRTGGLPRADGKMGLEVVRILVAAQEILEAQKIGQSYVSTFAL